MQCYLATHKAFTHIFGDIGFQCEVVLRIIMEKYHTVTQIVNAALNASHVPFVVHVSSEE